MVVNRRLGAESSATRTALMDAVEAVMRQEGYGALSARHVAERAQLKHQLVFYYFENMDDLLLATYRRHIDRYRETIEQALRTDRPLHAVWAVNSDPHDSVLNAEFLALANHNEPVRVETIRFGEELRTSVLGNLAERMQVEGDGKDALSPAAVMMAINFVGSLLGLETAIGISGAHTELHRLVEWCLGKLEPKRPASAGGQAPDTIRGSCDVSLR